MRTLKYLGMHWISNFLNCKRVKNSFLQDIILLFKVVGEGGGGVDEGP